MRRGVMRKGCCPNRRKKCFRIAQTSIRDSEHYASMSGIGLTIELGDNAERADLHTTAQ